MKLLNEEQTFPLAAAKSGMDEKTARKYRRLGKSEVNKESSWRTKFARSGLSLAKTWFTMHSTSTQVELSRKVRLVDLARRRCCR